MADATATRVVLLARDGEARTRLAAAVRQTGAELALVADPLAIGSAAILDVRPQAIVVALEPAIEDALERFEELFSNPKMTVIFDEAELAAQRSGWDAARWTRHLAAKLNRHGDVLPPGADVESDLPPLPGAPPDADHSHRRDPAAIADASHAADVAHGERPETRFASTDILGLAQIADVGVASSATTAIPNSSESAGPLAAVDDDADSAALDDAGSGLSLAADDEIAAIANARGGQSFERNLDALDEGLAGLSLADEDSYGHGPLRGAVVVEGGLGGPDAVRQLLAAMPETFARPVLVRLHLDGGRYDRLVKQMQRASTLPVALAEAGQVADAGTVYFLAPGLSIERSRAQLCFAVSEQSNPDLFSVLPARDSAVLVLSGTLDAHVAASASAMDGGALVVCQSPDSCYDAGASAALIGRGAEQAAAAELAARLADRWPS